MKSLFIFFSLLSLPALSAPLPDILISADKSQVSNQVDWQERREEMKYQLMNEVYGHWPKYLQSVFRKEQDRIMIVDGVETRYRQIKILFPVLGPESFIRLGVWLPAGEQKQGVFLTVNHCGNHTIVDDESLPIRQQPHHVVYCKDKSRGDLKKNYNIKKVIEAGFGLATFDVSDIDSDDARFASDGIKGLIRTHDDPARSWGTLSAWAWGLSKAVDYLVTDEGVESKQIIATGHSRRGKAALIATAMDERIAMTIPHQSGLGGTSSFRNARFRERPKFISHGSFLYRFLNEPNGLTHFFAPIFRDWSRNSRNLKKLPVDTHFLIALVAPRSLVDTQGEDDFWSGPDSAKKTLEAAIPAWNLHGHQVDLNDRQSRLQQVRIPGGHVQDESSWDLFIDIVKNISLENS